MQKLFEIIDCEQRSDEWFSARLGLITASDFSKVITTQGKKSASLSTLIYKKAAEKLLGSIEESYQSPAMERGANLEDEALEFLNFTDGFNFQKVGFCKSKTLLAGCSPDALDLERNIGLELKCPLPHTHIKYLMENRVPTDYWAQVQGSMLVTGIKQWVFCSYHPELKPLVLTVDFDEEFGKALWGLLFDAGKKIEEICEELYD